MTIQIANAGSVPPELSMASSSAESIALPPVTPTGLLPSWTMRDGSTSHTERRTSRPPSRKGQFTSSVMRTASVAESIIGNGDLLAEVANNSIVSEPDVTPPLVFNSLSNPPPKEEERPRGGETGETQSGLIGNSALNWPGMPYGVSPVHNPGLVYQGYWFPHPGTITPFTPRRNSQPPAYSTEHAAGLPLVAQGAQQHSYMPWIQVGIVSPINDILGSDAQQPPQEMYPATPRQLYTSPSSIHPSLQASY